MKHKYLNVLLFNLLTLTASAQETRQHDAHAHGIGDLNIVIEANELLIEFISPAANIIGFEYQPSTDGEKQALEDAQANLNQPEILFELSATAQCNIQQIEVKSSLISDHEGEEDDHGDQNEEHSAEKSEQEHEEHHDEGQAHAEFHAQYVYYCDNTEELSEINVLLFELFPFTEKLNVQMISESGQSAKTLNNDNFLIDL